MHIHGVYANICVIYANLDVDVGVFRSILRSAIQQNTETTAAAAAIQSCETEKHTNKRNMNVD